MAYMQGKGLLGDGAPRARVMSIRPNPCVLWPQPLQSSSSSVRPFGPSITTLWSKHCNRSAKQHNPSGQASRPFVQGVVTLHPQLLQSYLYPSGHLKLNRANLSQTSHHPTTAQRTTLDPVWTAHYCHYLTQPPQLVELSEMVVELVIQLFRADYITLSYPQLSKLPYTNLSYSGTWFQVEETTQAYHPPNDYAYGLYGSMVRPQPRLHSSIRRPPGPSQAGPRALHHKCCVCRWQR